MKPETTKIPKVISDSFYVDEQGIYELGFNSNSTYFIFHSFESKDSNYTHEILINDQMKLIPDSLERRPHSETGDSPSISASAIWY
jgi:hypothetical protein